MTKQNKLKPMVVDPTIDSDTEERDDSIIAVAFFGSLAVFLLLGVVGGGVAYWLLRPDEPPPERRTELAPVEIRRAPEIEPPTVTFTDITREAGIRFVHENGAYGQKLLPETMGGGCAFFDFNNNGHQDLLLINSTRWPWDPRATEHPPTMRLYQNRGDGTFEDVTAGSGLDVSMYAMGVAVGDYDNDGYVDVFISALGPNRLFRNLGNGTFEDVTEEAGVAGDPNEWSTSCGFFDFNNNGRLDLFVCNYLQWSREYDVAQNFRLTGGGRAYGRPQNFEGTFSYLYRNDGDGKFTDVSAEAGIQVRNPSTGVPMGKSLGVIFVDFEQNGYLDIVVANDTVQNFLFRNRGDGTFEEIGSLAGLAFDMNGNARGAMGIDFAHIRNDDALGIAIGNFSNEMTALYVAYNNQLQFTDEAIAAGLGPVTRLELTFAVLYFDYDLDGRLDLVTVNGHLEEDINRVQPSQHYEQPPQLFWNAGPEHPTEWISITEQRCGEDLLRPMVARGAAYADIDGDGDVDLFIMGVGQEPRLLRNDQDLGHHWLRFKLEGVHCNRDAIGARVDVVLGGKTLSRHVMPTRGYLSQVELPVTFGLGQHDQVDSVTVYWPDGSEQVLDDVEVDQMYYVKQDQPAVPFVPGEGPLAEME